MMKKRITVFLMTMAVLFSLPAMTAAADNGLTYVDPDGNFSVSALNGTLYLPSCTDYTDMRGLGLAAGTSVSDGNGHKTTVGNDSALDLTSIFGPMSAGKCYTVIIGFDEYTFIKSENVSSVHVISDKSTDYLRLSKDNEGTGTVSVIRADGIAVQDSDKNTVIPMKKIKGRGNNSWNHSGDKIAYNFNLKNKAELIDGAGKAKKWCLLSNNVDTWDSNATDMSSFIGLTMAQKLGIDYAVDFETVDLYINGEYRGVYMLTEKVEVGKNRVNINETKYSDDESPVRHVTNGSASDDSAILAGIQKYSYFTNVVQDGSCGGFLIERDYYILGEDDAAHFVTRNGIPFGIKSPEYPSQEQVQKIAIFVQEWEDAFFAGNGYNSKGKYYTEYMDMDSVVKMFALEVFTNEPDYDYSSMYYSVNWDGSGEITDVLRCGPAWDMDLCHYRNYMHGATPYGPDRIKISVPFKQLMQHGDFAQAFYNYTKTGTAFESAWNEMISQDFTAYTEKTSAAQAMSDIRWNRDGYYASLTANYLSDVAIRQNKWYDSLFTEEKLLGVTASFQNGTLTADISGSASSFAWYRVGSDYPVSSARTYTPTVDGAYYIKVRGTGIDAHSPNLLTGMTSNSVQVEGVGTSDSERFSLSNILRGIISSIRNSITFVFRSILNSFSRLSGR